MSDAAKNDRVLWEKVTQMENEIEVIQQCVGTHDKALTELMGHKDTGIIGGLKEDVVEMKQEIKQVRAMNAKVLLFALGGAGIGSAGVQAIMQFLVG